jgi:hypothetical protein
MVGRGLTGVVRTMRCARSVRVGVGDASHHLGFVSGRGRSVKRRVTLALRVRAEAVVPVVGRVVRAEAVVPVVGRVVRAEGARVCVEVVQVRCAGVARRVVQPSLFEMEGVRS